jgi:heparan sulfate 6-O-sulfotransferase HS6ST2
VKWLGLLGARHYYINSGSLLILSTLSCLKGGMALPAFAARALGPPLQPEQGAPARTTCPRRHSRVEAELAASRPGSVAASVRAGPPRGVSLGFNSPPLQDKPPKAFSSLAGALRAPLFALLPRGRRRRMHDLRRRWDLGSLCRALLTRGLAAVGHSLKHVLSAIFSKIFGPLARYVVSERGAFAPGPG